MLVYKFYPPNYGLQALKKRRLKVSPIDELNDPFEYQAIDMRSKSIRAWARHFRNKASENNGIISFSKNWHEPLMWAHYAESHSGMAIGFEIPDRLLSHINYISNKIIPPLDVDDNKKSMRNLVNQLLTSKHKNWGYEDEVRLLRKLDNCDEEGRLYFSNWNEVTIPKEVVLGDRYKSQENAKFQGVLEGDGIKFITARPEFKGFKMTPQMSSKLQKIL